jgi:ATP-dependent helicase/nuclease subunit A
MSIHQSKGLEFNVCLLFGFGKQFNMQNRYPLIFNKEFGPSMKLPPEYSDNVIDNISMRYEDNPIFKTVDKYNKLKQLEEEARIFYVALTRARERLVITATISKPYTEYLKRLRNTADSIYEIRKSRTYINWILLSIAKGDDAEKICDIKVFDKKKVSLTAPFSRALANIQSSASVGEDKDLAVLMNLKENTSPESALLANIPSKIAASKISSHMLDDTVFVPIPTGKLFSEDDGYNSEGDTETARQIKARIELMRSSKHDFESLLEENKKPTAAEIGTACHAFLQFCDYDNVEKNGLEEEILRLTDSRFISERTAKIINRSRIKGFFESELYKYVRQAKNIRREFHFGMFRPASDLTKSEDLKKIVNNKKIFVQGSVDLLLEMPDGSIILCDYKSDRIFPEERIDTSLFIHRMRETHAEQLAQYEYAISKIFSQKPDKIFIYSLALGDSIEL